MRLDGVIWQKSKIKSISGFLSVEGDNILFTKYRDGYNDPTKVLYTKDELKMNRLFDKIIGKLKPEKELFRVKKEELKELNITKMDPMSVGGKTYYTVYATFNALGESYSLTHSPKSQDETDKLGEIFKV